MKNSDFFQIIKNQINETQGVSMQSIINIVEKAAPDFFDLIYFSEESTVTLSNSEVINSVLENLKYAIEIEDVPSSSENEKLNHITKLIEESKNYKNEDGGNILKNTLKGFFKNKK